jgi:8-oxo-dGTP diphosphatase
VSEQLYELMPDVRSVDWLPLSDAVARLSRGYERAFLETVGPIALRAVALAEKARRSKARQPAPEKRRVRRPAAPTPSMPSPSMPSPSIGEPVPPPLQPALVPAMEEPTYQPAAGEVAELDAAVCSDDSGIEVFAPTVEPVSSVIEAARSARGGSLVRRMREWLRRVA